MLPEAILSIDGFEMRILALDLGSTKTGFAIGEAGSMPERNGSVKLRKSTQDAEFALSEVGKFLRDQFFMFEASRPDVVIVEDFLSKLTQGGSNARTIMVLGQMHGAVRGVAGLWGIDVRAVHGNTIKKHFIGAISAAPKTKGGATARARQEARQKTKEAIFARAVTLGYIPRGANYDEDRADACAVFDYASAVMFRMPPSGFQMFGGAA